MWWKQDVPATTTRAIAYYRHSAQDRQENSISIQKDQVRQFSRENGIKIIEEFADIGKSGLSIEGRDEFQRMLKYVVDQTNKFEYIMILDVSRWGRFQNINLSAHYMWLCSHYGRKIVFTKLGIQDEDDPLRQMVISFEKVRAATYSRELSDKVFKGCVKIAEQGYRAGGLPPYGMHRLLLNEQRKPVQILEPGQRKSIQNQRVTLTPGDNEQVKVVKRIFKEFVRKGQSPQEIAEFLNQDNIASPGGKKWSSDNVVTILKNETGQKLQSRTKMNPEAEWVRTKSAFKGVINDELFHQAQNKFLNQREEYQRIHSKEDMLAKLKAVYQRYGIITEKLISAQKNMLSASIYTKEFRSLSMAFQELFSEALSDARQTVVEQLRLKAIKVHNHDNYLVLNDSVSLIIQPSVPIPSGYCVYWVFRPDPRVEVDITLGVPLSNNNKFDILGYLVFPRILVESRIIKVFSSSEGRLDFHGYEDLDFIEELLK